MDEARRKQDSRRNRKGAEGFVWLDRKGKGGLHPGRRHAIRLGLVVARGQGWQGSGDEDAEWRKPACPRREADPRRRRVGALLLHRLPQSPPGLSQGVGRKSHQLGVCRRAVRPEVNSSFRPRPSSRRATLEALKDWRAAIV